MERKSEPGALDAIVNAALLMINGKRFTAVKSMKRSIAKKVFCKRLQCMLNVKNVLDVL